MIKKNFPARWGNCPHGQ